MGLQLFDRRWRWTVGTLQSENADFKFKVNRSLRPVAGTCTLEIYNLTKTHYQRIQSETHPFVRVEAGYASGPISSLFQGNAIKTHTTRDNADLVTKVTAGDGINALRTARASQSFGPSTRLEDVVRYLGTAMGVGVGNIGTALQDAALDHLDETFPHGTVVRGGAASELTHLLRSANLCWSIQDGALQIVPRNGALQRRAVVVSVSTGMLGVPEVAKNHVVTVTALIQPDLVPGRLIDLRSDMINGIYRIEAIEVTGDTQGNDWQVEMTTKLRDAPPARTP